MRKGALRIVKSSNQMMITGNTIKLNYKILHGK